MMGSEAYCIEQETLFCQKSLIAHRGEVKILRDGTGYIWGLDDQGKPLKLEIIREVRLDQKNDILFI